MKNLCYGVIAFGEGAKKALKDLEREPEPFGAQLHVHLKDVSQEELAHEFSKIVAHQFWSKPIMPTIVPGKIRINIESLLKADGRFDTRIAEVRKALVKGFEEDLQKYVKEISKALPETVKPEKSFSVAGKNQSDRLKDGKIFKTGEDRAKKYEEFRLLIEKFKRVSEIATNVAVLLNKKSSEKLFLVSN